MKFIAWLEIWRPRICHQDPKVDNFTHLNIFRLDLRPDMRLELRHRSSSHRSETRVEVNCLVRELETFKSVRSSSLSFKIRVEVYGWASELETPYLTLGS